MNEEYKEMVEELGELKHKIEKLERKAQQKLGMRGGYGRGGGYQRMGQNSGNWNSGQSIGQSGGVFWGQQPMNPIGGQFPQEDSWFDQRYM